MIVVTTRLHPEHEDQEVTLSVSVQVTGWMDRFFAGRAGGVLRGDQRVLEMINRRFPPPASDQDETDEETVEEPQKIMTVWDRILLAAEDRQKIRDRRDRR